MELNFEKKLITEKVRSHQYLNTKQILTKKFPVLTAFAMSAKTKFATET